MKLWYCLINLDASNAYNSFSINYLHKILIKHSPLLANWMIFLYGNDFQTHWNTDDIILFRSGAIQGMTTSALFYGTIKYEVQKNINIKCLVHSFNNIKLNNNDNFDSIDNSDTEDSDININDIYDELESFDDELSVISNDNEPNISGIESNLHNSDQTNNSNPKNGNSIINA